MSSRIMAWIDTMLSVEKTDFQARRDAITATVAEAAEVLEAGEVKKAEGLRAKAYFASCKLESDAKAHWSIGEVEAAKARWS